MPPSSGRIQDLPVKILYSIDTASQSYVTVLPERQPVYVHSVASSNSQDESGLGSCYLKGAARGICFASPECIPNSTSLDFSVYNLDPSLRNRPPRAFPPQIPGSMDEAWTGKGFLSWVLTENGTGKTLIKGRLVRDYDFSPSAFNDQGGLEGLMAAASSSSRSNGQREDADGRGWGLEVCLSLKMVNPEGKDEFKGRREFEEMLRRGTSLASVSSPASIAASTPRANRIMPAGTDPIRRNPPSAQRIGHLPPPPPPQMHHSSSNASNSSVRPSPSAQQQSLPQHSMTRPPSRGSTSSVPPSSIPMQPSSSNGAPSAPPQLPRHSSSASIPPQQSRQPPQHYHSSSSIPTASSSTHVASSRPHSREVTPPPLPQRRSPPPSTPSREKLAALLRTDEKMSPSMAKQLAQNPVLLKLLKAVPPGGLSFGHDQKNGSPDSGGAPTPTPNGPTASTSKAVSVDPSEACCNCGATETDLWRTKNMKDGTKKKVCNACGLYFNKHKRMRPQSLWGTTAFDDLPPSDKRQRIEEQPVRHSPRLQRGASDSQPPSVPPVAESPRKRKSTKPIPQPSPRMSTRASARQDNGAGPSTGMEGKHLDFGNDNLFSPSTMFGTSPAQPIPNPALGVDNNTLMTGLEGLGDGELDIEALLNQIAAADGTNGFSLDAFFGNTDTNGTNNNGGGDATSFLDMLNSWDDGNKNGTG